MTYEQAKSLLRKSKTLADRESAIIDALKLGMPLHEIEQFLDWLDGTKLTRTDGSENELPEPVVKARRETRGKIKRVKKSDG